MGTRTLMFKITTDEWVNSDEFQLNILSNIVTPDAVFIFLLNINFVDNLISYCVLSTRERFADFVMSDVGNSQNTGLLKGPSEKIVGKFGIAGMVKSN